MGRHWADAAASWTAHEAVFDGAFVPVTEAVLGAVGPRPGQRVLDVGCGSGTLLETCAALGAEVVGVDVAPGMVEAARRRVPAATVLEADAQTADLRAPVAPAAYDAVVSRFGAMFFADPSAAFANVRSAVAPGGRLAFACWRSYDENPMFSLGTSVLHERLDPRPPSPVDGEPGPCAFASGTSAADALVAAGWTDVAVEPLDVVLDYGRDGTDGVEGRLATILAGSTGRRAHEELLPVLGEGGWAALVEQVRDVLRSYAAREPDGVLRVPGACWLVTARNAS
ncbi:MAG: methyltransferase type 11 [Nocardioides sp.]|nr:methyltransferase type 11 [Nocardioides sp.]